MSEASKVRLPLCGVLGLIFITLKLTGHIAWSWLWVLAPFWAPLGILLTVLIAAGLVTLVIAAIAVLVGLVQNVFEN